MMFVRYAIYRFITMLLTLWVVSILIFVIINLPPGDYRVGAWSEFFSGPSRAVTVHSGEATSVELPMQRIREVK